jgi:N-formylglutamate deformylase
VDLFRFTPGRTPLLINVPHAGTYLPDELAARLTSRARALPDTDWHVERLYEFAPALGAGLLVASHSRYLVDLNRSPDSSPLYAGADNTELCPTTDFERHPLYADTGVPGAGAPDTDEVAERLARYWQPYHDKLAAEIGVLKERFGFALVLDGHSIRSVLPRFFEGTLPDLNLGTANGRATDSGLRANLFDLLREAEGFSAVCDGRFTGGQITRHYGRPDENVYVVQLEIAQAAYLDEDEPTRFDSERARPLTAVIERVVAHMLEWAEFCR